MSISIRRPSRPVVHAALAVATLAVASPGCGLISVIAGKAKKSTVNMDKWEVKKMQVGLRQADKKICPGQSVQMAVFAEAEKKKSKKHKTKTLQTWDGDPERANRIGKMGFEQFEFVSSHGDVDENGYFHANPDVLATAATGFSIATKYRENPSEFSFDQNYEPTYSCIVGAGGMGEVGQAGQYGASGPGGKTGESGGSDGAGGQGSAGGAGGNGSDGSHGAAGPVITAYATVVKTPFYDHLGILRVTGDREDVVLFDLKSTLSLSAVGGSGGPGGDGGSGGSGGAGGSGYAGGTGGNGGPGGVGGNGGNGGPGGQVTLVYDDRFPELANVIQLDASGGAAGHSILVLGRRS